MAGFRRNYANDDKKMRLQGSIIEKRALPPSAPGRRARLQHARCKVACMHVACTSARLCPCALP